MSCKKFACLSLGLFRTNTLKSSLMTLSLWTLIPGNCCVKTVCQLNYFHSPTVKTVSQYAVKLQLDKADQLKNYWYHARWCSLGRSLCHENTSASVIAYAHSIHRNQITLQKMDSTNTTQWRKLHFLRGNSENTYGMYGHSLSNMQNKTNSIFLFESNLKSIWLYNVYA